MATRPAVPDLTSEPIRLRDPRDSKPTGARSAELKPAIRLAWAKAHAATLRDLLDAPPTRTIPQRLYRTRLFMDGDFTVITMMQNHLPKTHANGQKEPSVVTWVSRGYDAPAGHVVQQAVMGAYSVDEIVAFLKLDRVNPATVEWQDETPSPSSQLAVVGDLLGMNGA